MTNSEMIKTLREILSLQYSSCYKMLQKDGTYQYPFAKQSTALTHAIELLEAEEEVERLRASILSCGCQYCLDGIDIIQMKFPNTHECGGTWWKESVRTPKYCPMCGRKLPEAAEKSEGKT